MNKSKKIFFMFLFPFLVALAAWVVMSLWNWIIPDLTGWGTLSFIKALGLLVLCKILFGGFGHSNKRPNWKKRKKHMEMYRRWKNMSQEEKAALKLEMKNKFNVDDDRVRHSSGEGQ